MNQLPSSPMAIYLNSIVSFRSRVRCDIKGLLRLLHSRYVEAVMITRCEHPCSFGTLGSLPASLAKAWAGFSYLPVVSDVLVLW